MKLFKSLKKTMIALIAGVTVSTAAAAGIGGLSVQKVSADSLPQQTDSNLNLDVKAAIAVDAKTGQILYAKNAEQALPVAINVQADDGLSGSSSHQKRQAELESRNLA